MRGAGLEGLRAIAPELGQGYLPAGFSGAPRARGPHARGGRAPREEAGLGLRAPGAGSCALSWALLSPAVRCRDRGPGAPR